MVRVIEDSPEEKATEKKNLEIMVEVAGEMFGEENVEIEGLRKVIIWDNRNSIDSDIPIQIFSSCNEIYVFDKKYLNSAIELGEAIEKRILGLELDLKKMY